MRFKVGDKVRIRKDLVTNRQYGNNTVMKEMLEFLDEETKIAKVGSFDYSLEIDDGYWGWTDEMLESVEKEFITDEEIACVEENMEDNEFSVGDKVRFRENIEGVIEYISKNKDVDDDDYICLVLVFDEEYYRIPMFELELIQEPKFEVGQEVIDGAVKCVIKWVSDELDDFYQQYKYVTKDEEGSYDMVIEGDLKEVK